MKRIPLRNRGGETVAHALVDDEDYVWASKFRWSMRVGRYAARRGPRQEGLAEGLTAGRQFYLHREILGLAPGDGLEGDHKNRDTLDNRRSNLHIVTRAEQMQNIPAKGVSRYRGVAWYAPGKKWRVQVVIDGRIQSGGYFFDEIEAAAVAAAYREAFQPNSEEARA